MAATSGVLARKILVVGLLSVGCFALLLFCSRLVAAEPVEASWYGPGFEGNLTANGEVFDPSQYTAAHKTLEFGTKLIVTYEGRSVVVRINDRGPFITGRDLDLSKGAADYIGLTSVGVAVVDVETADASTPVGPYAPPGARAAARAQPSATQAQPAENGSENEEDQGRQNSPDAAESDSSGTTSPDATEDERDFSGATGPGGAAESGGGAGGAAAQQDQYAASEQYATEDQYASKDQYEDNKEMPAEKPEPAPPAPAPPAPEPATPVLPPEPEPEALIAPPAELAVPNSTVVRRVELGVAAPPKPKPAPASETAEPEAAEPEPKPAPEPEVAEPEAEPDEPKSEPAEPKKEPAEPKKEEPKEKEASEEEEPEITVLPDTGGVSPVLPAVGVMLLGAGLTVRLLRR